MKEKTLYFISFNYSDPTTNTNGVSSIVVSDEFTTEISNMLLERCVNVAKKAIMDNPQFKDEEGNSTIGEPNVVITFITKIANGDVLPAAAEEANQ